MANDQRRLGAADPFLTVEEVRERRRERPLRHYACWDNWMQMKESEGISIQPGQGWLASDPPVEALGWLGEWVVSKVSVGMERATYNRIFAAAVATGAYVVEDGDSPDVRWNKEVMRGWIAANPILAMGPPPDPVTKAASLGDVLKEREDRAQELLDTTPESTLLIMYKLLYARGVRISSIDHDINTAIKKEEA